MGLNLGICRRQFPDAILKWYIHEVFVVNLVVSPRSCEVGVGPRSEKRGRDPGRPRMCEGNRNKRKGLRRSTQAR